VGGATRQKQEELAEAEAQFQLKFSTNSKELEAKLAVPLPPVSQDFNEYRGFFVRDVASFQLKTKSKDRNKQRLEFVRHVFHKYPVPTFMFEAWETPKRQPQPYWRQEAQERIIKGFATKDDYRLWYICIATGGSFYKEYGQVLFTKKECHTFLNCKHNLSIEQAVVYSIAYNECHNVGNSLRIAKSKIEDRAASPFWREVIRLFARLEPKSKEDVDDIVDYILYKRQENPEFTVIGKGHTLDSLCHKVEEWHQDLRRLKAIGESEWDGIPVEDRGYTQKNRDGSTDFWRFTQIKSAKMLQQEGNAMRHCVLGYKSQCISGISSIWSLTFNGSRKLTIEVNRSGSIVQVRGLANRVARPDERNIVSKWASACRFSYRG
jgi:hypothetical protein